MHDAAVKTAVDRFLKNVSQTARAEIEKSLKAGLAKKELSGKDSFAASITLNCEPLGLNVTIYSKIVV